MGKKVIAAMSGGVDSSVAAYILKEEGYDVIGVNMRMWCGGIEENGNSLSVYKDVCISSGLSDVEKVASRLGIPFYTVDACESFKQTVIGYFIDEYYKGRTPNPCIACNRYIKWGSLLEWPLAAEADYIATGHYANKVKLKSGRYTLKADIKNPKDQTYALCNLTQSHLSRTLFPLAGVGKDEVRKIASNLGLVSADKPDSQEICFIPDNDYAKFIEENGKIPVLPGNFTDAAGNVLGRHKGIIHYTVGQRKGLGLSFGKRMFVKRIDAADNTVILCEEKDIFSKGFIAEGVNFMAVSGFDVIECYVKIRYSHKWAECRLTKMENDALSCEFNTPQRAVTPGQSAVFYDGGGNLICSGVIEAAIDF